MVRESEEILLQVAEMYYFDGLTQATIAKRLGCTRWTISRMLERAREQGLIQISINHPHSRSFHLEQQLKENFNLREARVSPCLTSGTDTARAVYSQGAKFLSHLLLPNSTLAVGWGYTTARIAEALQPHWQSGVTVVQTHGSPSYTEDDVVTNSIRSIANKSDGVGRLIPSPAIVQDPGLARSLYRDRTIAKTLQLAAQADALMYSAGLISTCAINVKSGYISHDDVERLKQAGAVADILCRVVNVRGEIVDPDLNERTISINLDAIKNHRCPIVVGVGTAKAFPIYTALKNGFAKVAIMDASLAQTILELDSYRNR